jgi:site-specific DNA recombinase
MKAYLIARVSTEDQADALPAQLYRLRDYAERNEMDYEVFEIQESAFKGDREQFQKVLNRLKKEKEPIALVFDKVDRYSRDPSSPVMQIVKKYVEERKVALHFCSDHFKIDHNSSAGERMMLSMNTVMSEYYSGAISDNVKRRNEQLHRDGLWTGRAPFGYINTEKDGRKWIEPHPLLADAVRDAFTMYSSGSFTLSSIKNLWQEKYKYRAGLSLVAKVLHNDFYSGTMRTTNGVFDHAYDHLVSNEIYDAVQRTMLGYKQAPRKYASLPFAYRGMVTCAECGCRVTFEIKKNRYTYGHCTQFRGKHNASYVNEDEFTRQFAAALGSIRIPEGEAERILTQLKKDLKAGEVSKRADIMRLEKSRRDLEERCDKLYEHFAAGVIEQDYYKKRYLELQSEIEKNKKRAKTFELDSKIDIQSISHLLKFVNNAKDTFIKASNDEKRELLEKVLSNSELSGDSLLLKMKKPYELMAFCNDNSTRQGHVEYPLDSTSSHENM